jgi:putative two-component system response regulator
MAALTIAQFKELVSRNPHSADPEVRRALISLTREARTKLTDSAHNSSEFFSALRQLLRSLKGNSNAQLRISCLLDCAHYFHLNGSADSGIRAAEDAAQLAGRTKDLHSLRKAQTLLGILWADTGGIAQAVEAYAEAIALSLKLDDQRGYALNLVNLGVALMYAGQYEDAIRCFTKVELLALEADSGDLVELVLPHARGNKAFCFLRQGKIRDGLSETEKCLVSPSSNGSIHELFTWCIREFTYIQLLLEANKTNEAASRLDILRNFAHRAGTPRAQVLADIAEGAVEIATGDPHRGLTILLQAEAKAHHDNVVHHDAVIALVRAYEQLGRFEDALRSLRAIVSEVQRKAADLASYQLGISAEVPSRDGRQTNEALRTLEHREALLRAKVAEDRLVWSQIETLERLAVTADMREDVSGEHGYRVGRLAAALAEDLGWSEESCLSLDLAARLHDIGKMAVPERILLTSAQLRDAERHFMRQHTVFGFEILSKSDIAEVQVAQDIALFHHECWDGTGYPKKLRGKRIPIHARIVALADVFDALTHGRPYAEPWSMDRAIEEIRNRRGTQFDPDLTDRFLVLIERLRAQHENLDEFLARASRHSPFLQARRKIKLMLEQERDQERQATVAGNRTRH